MFPGIFLEDRIMIWLERNPKRKLSQTTQYNTQYNNNAAEIIQHLLLKTSYSYDVGLWDSWWVSHHMQCQEMFKLKTTVFCYKVTLWRIPLSWLNEGSHTLTGVPIERSEVQIARRYTQVFPAVGWLVIPLFPSPLGPNIFIQCFCWTLNTTCLTHMISYWHCSV